MYSVHPWPVFVRTAHGFESLVWPADSRTVLDPVAGSYLLVWPFLLQYITLLASRHSEYGPVHDHIWIQNTKMEVEHFSLLFTNFLHFRDPWDYYRNWYPELKILSRARFILSEKSKLIHFVTFVRVFIGVIVPITIVFIMVISIFVKVKKDTVGSYNGFHQGFIDLATTYFLQMNCIFYPILVLILHKKTRKMIKQNFQKLLMRGMQSRKKMAHPLSSKSC